MGMFIDTGFEGYNEFLTIQRDCGIGTRLPQFAGSWVVAGNTICSRFDITPGVISCGDIISEPDGNSATTGGVVRTIQYGQVVESIDVGPDTCYLENE